MTKQFSWCVKSLLLPKWLFCLKFLHIALHVQCAQLFTGRSCTSGGDVSIAGECKLLQDCPSALSNFRAGISPSLCYQENEVPLVCCQSERRISARKCDEYAEQLLDIQQQTPGFAPFYAGNYYEKSPPRSENNVPTGICNYTNAQAFIVGGRPADRNEMSFTVALGYEDANNQISWKCGGTLISEQYVLTAAHCADGKASKPPTTILIGDKHLYKLDTFSSSSRVEAAVEKIIVHPEYSRPIKYHDIALIKLDRKVKFSRMVMPACLPQPEQRPEAFTELLIAGWGRLEYFGKRGDVLQVTNITRYNLKECNDVYQLPELPDGIIKKQVCAGDLEGQKDSCSGDSGGPLVSKHDRATCMQSVIGVTSLGDQFCGSGIPGIYTNVQSYLNWIEKEVWSDT